MSEQNRHMLMFTLGPVQSLIAQARKTRDLWVGSYLLSKLMEAAMEVEGINDKTFVFPGNRRIKADIPDLPNKYVALFDSPKRAEAVARQSETNIADCWYAICNEVRDRLLANHYTSHVQDIWERQTNVRQFFEIYWVIVPELGKKYGPWLQETIQALDARKRLRDFLPQDEPGEKSTVSGEREALHEEGTTRKAVQTFWHQLTASGRHTVKDIRKDGSERLDAIDSIKRFALYSSHLKPNLELVDYPSTSSIATTRFVEKLLSSHVIEAQLQDWQQLTEGGLALMPPGAIPYFERNQLAGDKKWILQRDGDCFFPEAFTPRYLKENYRITTQAEEKQREPDLRLMPETFIPDCLAALEKVRRAAGADPTPYYALVQMDGDHMGTIMSKVADDVQHRALSTALSTFARERAPKIVQQDHPGRLIYAGGDDVLAMTPLDGMLTMINYLQQAYKATVAPMVSEDWQKDVTASMGIAIAHHFTPLSVVRRAALEAEKLAKNRYGRNAFVVTLLRRSGEQTRVGCRWYYSFLDNREQPLTPIELFQTFSNYFQRKIFSPKSIYILLDEVSALIGMERSAQRSEIGRVLKRQLTEHLTIEQQILLIGQIELSGNEQLIAEEKEQRITKKIAALADQVVALAEAMDREWEAKAAKEKELHLSVELRDDALRYGLVEILGWLLVMAFLAKEGLES